MEAQGMREIKTDELEGNMLDAAVAMAIGKRVFIAEKTGWLKDTGRSVPRYSRNWDSGGRLIQQHRISLDMEALHFAPCVARCAGGSPRFGPTPLIAAMRALVGQRLGDWVVFVA